MGFSVSGATAIILLAGMLAFGIAFTAATNSFEVVSDAQDDRSDRLLDQQNSGIEITDVSYDDGSETANITVENTGATELSVSGTDLLIDGELQTNGITNTTVAGKSDTDVWLPGEPLTFVVDREASPERVKVAAETGISDIEVEGDG